MTAEAAAWAGLVEALREAGERLGEATAESGEDERADGYRALLRGLQNQLARFEVDRDRPELVPFNGWRQKFFMDNPDTRYWVADLRGDRRYRLTGHCGDAVYTSITAYAGGSGAVAAAARLDGTALGADFSVLVGGPEPESGPWLPLPAGNVQLWVRQFHDDVDRDRHGWCAIEPIDVNPVPAAIEPGRFRHQLGRLGATVRAMPAVFAAVDDQVEPNTVRHWAEMTGGAAYTEPGVHYLRGGWRLGPGEALVIEGETVPCRHWNALLYSRFLNSLDYRHRQVSVTGGNATVTDGRYRLVLAAADPGVPDWLDTEGRPTGLVVLRWLHADRPPELPRVRVCPIGESAGEAR